MEQKNILQRINAVRKAIGYVQKDKSVSTGGGSYKAVTHDTVTAMLRPEMVKHGIVCFPELIASASLAKEEGSKQFRYEATYAFHFVNVEEPTDRLTITIQAHAMDNADKAPGKALSYAKKYAMLKLFEIETGEDEESRYAEKEPFDVKPHLDLMDAATTVEELGTAYLAAKKAALAAGDTAVVKTLDGKGKALKAKLMEVKP